ncbi:uncharacterized protein CMU_037740 [Cryptosporidium muris RN66]|uniref:Zinc-finger domain-containing protein n=1 Tax=Cryptosporidium muris (strain RN66) TaxID=441375 RepID=B6A918_CRYMR|nr:uncharacterized protein CMU_037740 [Cryptosporidium muris RN66]EEA04709.1 hypothetical protein, conserved [Cryptosporidium muris RN66]|eukprot:XP_002139058.1 hypothetical protein [Cryptosporidium muris RN66]
MSVTLGSILFPERRLAAPDNRRGIHSKRKKPINFIKNQEQTPKQLTTRLLLDDETIGPQDFLTLFSNDDIRNTEQFWEAMERVFYPIDERWLKVLEFTGRPDAKPPCEKTSIGIHFAYRWALQDLFDIEELFILLGINNRNNEDHSISEDNTNNKDEVNIITESTMTEFLFRLNLPTLEIPGMDPRSINKLELHSNLMNVDKSTNETNKLSIPTSEVDNHDILRQEIYNTSKFNVLFEEWKVTYNRAVYIEHELDKIIIDLKASINKGLSLDFSRRSLSRYHRKVCREYVIRALHYHSIKQFIDSLEEILYYDANNNEYLTTWDDGESVRVSWIKQDQLLQLLLFRKNTLESKYFVSLPKDQVAYASYKCDNKIFEYLYNSGLTPINIENSKISSEEYNSSQKVTEDKYLSNDNIPNSSANIDTCEYSTSDNSTQYSNIRSSTNISNQENIIRSPPLGCISLTRVPLCHYCRRGSTKLKFSRCPSKIKYSGSLSSNTISSLDISANSSNSLAISYSSRSLIPWATSSEIQDKEELVFPLKTHKSKTGYNTFGSLSPQKNCNNNTHICRVPSNQICNICQSFGTSKDQLNESNDVFITRGITLNNCWRMYCSDCILHNFSSIIKQKYSNGVLLRYYCPFCNGTCNCERCLRNQQLRKLKNYLKTHFCGHFVQCSIPNKLFGREITWYEFMKQFGGSKYIIEEDSQNIISDTSNIPCNNLDYACYSYISNLYLRLSITEDTHLGSLWLQANNISVQTSQSSDNKDSSNTNTKIKPCSSNKQTNSSISRSKSRQRSSLNSSNRYRRSTTGNSSTSDISQVNSIGRQTSCIPSQQTTAPSIYIPKEVMKEPTGASGMSVLWSLRSVLCHNISKCYKDCARNVEAWEEIIQTYRHKKHEIENYCQEIMSQLQIMDRWIKSITFTETNKRFIMRKMPLLCWATNMQSAKPFNFDEFPQILPENNALDLLRHMKHFILSGYVPDSLPNYRKDSDSTGNDHCALNDFSEKKLTCENESESFSTTQLSPSSYMNLLFEIIPDLPKIDINSTTYSNINKDIHYPKTSRRKTAKRERIFNIVNTDAKDNKLTKTSSSECSHSDTTINDNLHINLNKIENLSPEYINSKCLKFPKNDGILQTYLSNGTSEFNQFYSPLTRKSLNINDELINTEEHPKTTNLEDFAMSPNLSRTTLNSNQPSLSPSIFSSLKSNNLVTPDYMQSGSNTETIKSKTKQYFYSSTDCVNSSEIKMHQLNSNLEYLQQIPKQSTYNSSNFEQIAEYNQNSNNKSFSTQTNFNELIDPHTGQLKTQNHCTFNSYPIYGDLSGETSTLEQKRSLLLQKKRERESTRRALKKSNNTLSYSVGSTEVSQSDFQYQCNKVQQITDNSINQFQSGNNDLIFKNPIDNQYQNTQYLPNHDLRQQKSTQDINFQNLKNQNNPNQYTDTPYNLWSQQGIKKVPQKQPYPGTIYYG